MTVTRRDMVRRYSGSAAYVANSIWDKVTPENIKKVYEMGKKVNSARKSLLNAFKKTRKSVRNKRSDHVKPMPARDRTGVPLTKAASKLKGKTTNHKKGNKVVVTKDFKDKVVKALADRTTSGSWDQISFDTIPISTIPLNGQAVNGLGELFSNDYSNWAFDPEDILHAASVLWNNKSDSQINRLWNSEGSLGVSVASTIGQNSVNDLKLPFASKHAMNVKITVKRCYEVYKMKNESQRTITMKIYLCEPKRQGSMGNGPLSFPSDAFSNPTTTTVLQSIGNPGEVWASELRKQHGAGMNVNNVTPNLLYNKPTLCPVFNKLYKADETTVVLEPGQVYEYFINGPTNFTFNFANFFQGTGAETIVYSGVQKFMRYPLFTAYVDLVTDGSNAGRYPTTVASGSYQGIALERQLKLFLECPETVGGGLNVTKNTGGEIFNLNGAIENNYRRDCYFKTVYTRIGPFGRSARVDVQDPGDEIIIDAL